MVLPIHQIYGKKFERSSRTDSIGCSSLFSEQLFRHAYSPRISVLSSESADEMVRQFGDLNDTYHLFTYFENIFAYGDDYNKDISFPANIKPSPSTTLAGTGCVRFVKDVLKDENYDIGLDLFDLEHCEQELKDYLDQVNEGIKDVMEGEVCYESYRKHYRAISSLQNSVYLKHFASYHRSEIPSSVDCFNHPVMQVVVVTGNDTMQIIKNLVSSIDTRTLPKWFDSSSLLQHIMILVDEGDNSMLQNALKFQEDLKVKYGKKSTVVPINTNSAKDSIDMKQKELLPSLFSVSENVLKLSPDAFNTWKRPIQEFLTKDLIIFMNKKIRNWTEDVVSSRTSITGRLFGNRKWGSSAKTSFFSFGSAQTTSTDKSLPSGNEKETSYNSSGNYYLGNSSEMILRKLGDWYFMLGDYKNAFSTYELIKKDMLNDKAHLHLASLQEYTVFSLLLGAVVQSPNESQSVTPKLISSTITPLLDSSFYSFLSRSNLKSHTINLIVSAAEMYLMLAETLIKYDTTFSVNTNSLIELYLNESLNLFRKIVDSKIFTSISNAYYIQRIAYVYTIYDRAYPISPNVEPPYYEEDNDFKKKVLSPNLERIGSSRNRKTALWLILTAKELHLQKQAQQMQMILWRLSDQISIDAVDSSQMDWLKETGGLLDILTRELP